MSLCKHALFRASFIRQISILLCSKLLYQARYQGAFPNPGTSGTAPCVWGVMCGVSV
jgi:hypothetical protein